MNALARPLQRLLSAAAWLYLSLLFAWLFLYLLFGDGSGFLGLLNAVALWFFAPLPLVAFLALSTRHRLMGAFVLLGAFTFFWLWGPQLVPKAAPELVGDRLRVMSVNVLGRAGDVQPVMDTLRSEEPDVLLIQELTPELAAIISVQFAEAYPYQLLNPGDGARGMGILSRYPIQPLDVILSGVWIGPPQIVELDWNGQALTLVNFHTRATGTLWPHWVRRSFAERDAALQALADFVAVQSAAQPVIVAGDANVSQLNEAYQALTAVMEDSWLEAGRGFGHTFPGPIEDGIDYAQVSFLRVPYWLVRIDYIFHSAQWTTASIRLADFYGGTDHRGLVADFVLTE